MEGHTREGVSVEGWYKPSAHYELILCIVLKFWLKNCKWIYLIQISDHKSLEKKINILPPSDGDFKKSADFENDANLSH